MNNRLLFALSLIPFSHAALAQMPTGTLVDRIVRRIDIRGDRTFDILLLSGGGEYGAYGTGFLRGWQSRATDPMPKFDMVTGVSTGALISPFAFAGDEQSLAEISREYTENAASMKPSFEYLFFLKRDGGLLDRRNLENSIDRLYGESLAARARRGFDEGRILLVGTTNLRSGLGSIWNIEEELGRGPGGLGSFQKILLASAAIPGAFAPVEIKGDPHVDGGVASNTLLGLDLSDFQRLAERLRAGRTRGTVRIRLWVIVNKPLYPSVETSGYRGVGAVRDRGERLLFGLKELQTLTRYWELSEAVNSGVPGLSMEVRCTAVPQDMTAKVTINKIFDQAFMKKLDQFGFERARGRQQWDRLPLSPYQRPQ
ncbi:patatin-like phospholipase family protein [Paludibaculum fermentans]|uniref:Patatin-like phospholipase family protein n=1 Tax=Paludibaculum fermentans TaxID=1473598 RepID=A0A7S7NLL2_PALFE|nr:patatin-like phospholipase family protein [Paludibaculum fermentans]QOY85891.1 patatin-like phospholipase family protein [Paludibaculum fermentans]